MDDLNSKYFTQDTKRFTVSEDSLYDNDVLLHATSMTWHDKFVPFVVNLLNEQYERIQQLEAIEARVKTDIAYLDSRIASLENLAKGSEVASMYLNRASENEKQKRILEYLLTGEHHDTE